MKGFVAVVTGIGLLSTFTAVAGAACPAEVGQARDLLTRKGGIKAEGPQAPKSLAGARGGTEQNPRGGDFLVKRGQDAQNPRGEDFESKRGQDAQNPRGQDAQNPRGQAQPPRSLAGVQLTGKLMRAQRLVHEAETACKAGDEKTAKEKAQAAIADLK